MVCTTLIQRRRIFNVERDGRRFVWCDRCALIEIPVFAHPSGIAVLRGKADCQLRISQPSQIKTLRKQCFSVRPVLPFLSRRETHPHLHIRDQQDHCGEEIEILLPHLPSNARGFVAQKTCKCEKFKQWEFLDAPFQHKHQFSVSRY